MKKETIKETGKLFLDFTKIIFAVAIITPLVKEGSFDILPIFFGTIILASGIYLINKGVHENE